MVEYSFNIKFASNMSRILEYWNIFDYFLYDFGHSYVIAVFYDFDKFCDFARVCKSEFSDDSKKCASRVCQDPRNSNSSTRKFPDSGDMPKNGENGKKVGLA